MRGGWTHDAWTAVKRRVHERRVRDLVEQRGLEPPFWAERFGVGAPQVCSLVCEQGGHHYLCFGREVQVARVRVWDDERVVARGACNERGGREDAERLFEDGMYCVALRSACVIG